MTMPASPSPTVAATELRLFGTLWSLREYPSKAREWSWAMKLATIRAARFDGVFAPPHPSLADRGHLLYWGATSLDAKARVAPAFRAARELGALAINIQLGDHDSPLGDMIALAVHVRDVARDFDLPFTIETHRDTFTETPEATLALFRGYQKKARETMPLCLDHSHFAVVRHLWPADFWPRLREPPELLAAANHFHLRPFNGHHCQIPVLNAAGRRTREYRDWRPYAAALFAHLHTRPATGPIFVVPELGHANPTYGLSCFGDTWRDVQALTHDLRRLWRAARL